jgi:hypothetical protein
MIVILQNSTGACKYITFGRNIFSSFNKLLVNVAGGFFDFRIFQKVFNTDGDFIFHGIAPYPDKPELKNICHQGTKQRRILFRYSFLVSWCLCGEKKKVLP